MDERVPDWLAEEDALVAANIAKLSAQHAAEDAAALADISRFDCEERFDFNADTLDWTER